MIKLHREGRDILMVAIGLLIMINSFLWWLLPTWAFVLLAFASLALYVFIVQFFRNPDRVLPVRDENLIYAPADGKVCAIEEVFEPEYFKDNRLLVSIFMSPLNVHVNRNPVSGEIAYFEYHKGKYLTAWHPKSSTENERSTVVYNSARGSLLMRQVAGAVARRIRYYVQPGDRVEQGEEMGFIKFGSRVDLYLPLDVALQVRLDDPVKGKVDVIGRFTA